MNRSTLLVTVALLGCGASPSTTPDTGSSADGGAAHDGGAGAPLCSLADCGGDVVGRWAFDTDCRPTRPAPVDGCTSSSNAPFFDTHVEGTLELRADGTATTSTRLAQDIYIYLPTHCLRDGQTCEEFVIGATCTVREGFCDCATLGTNPLETDPATYAVSGSQLTLSDASGDTDFTYCVSGDTLRYSHPGDTIPEHLHRIP